MLRAIVGPAILTLFALGLARAQDPAPPAPARLAPVETEATEAAAETAEDELRLAKELAAGGKQDEARAALRSAVDFLLAVPGRAQSAKLADALEELGRTAASWNDTECAVRALEVVLAHRAAALGDDDARVQELRAIVGRAGWELGRLDTSKVLLERVLEHARRTLAPDDRRLCTALSDCAVTLYYLDDCEGARALMTEAIEILTRKHGADDPQIQWAFGNLGNILDKQGDVDGAVESRERVHRIFCKSRPEGHPDVLIARHNLALSLSKAGDPIAARALLMDVRSWYEKRFPPGHLKLERTLQNLAITLHELGDYESARILLEGIVQRRGNLAKDPTLISAQANLVRVLAALDRTEEAAALSRKQLERLTAEFGADSRHVLEAETALAVQLSALGDHPQAKELKAKVVRTLEQRFPEDEYDLMFAQGRLAFELESLGETQPAIELFERALASSRRLLGDGHELTLQLLGLLSHAIEKVEPERARQLLRELGLQLVASHARSTAALSTREAELEVSSLAPLVDLVLAGPRRSEEDALAFELVETVRLASWAGARSAALLEKSCTADESVRKLRDALRSKAAQVAKYAQQGRREEYQRAALARGELEQELAAAVRGFAAASPGTMKPAAIGARLAPGSVAISFRRYLSQDEDARERSIARYTAFVLRPGGALRRIELGTADAVDAALERWRRALGIGGPAADAQAQKAAGEALRALLVDPLRESAGDAKRWIVAPDDVLHLVPLDALPSGNGVVGDELRIEVRTHLGELARAPAAAGARRDLLALGAVDFDALPVAPAASAAVEQERERPAALPARRGERQPPRPAHFLPLAASEAEIAGVVEVFEAFAGKGAQAAVLEGAGATKPALVEAVHKARWLHLATHGWFAPATFAALGDDGAGAQDFAREVRGLSPRVLCGLALAGANAPEDVAERASGLLTAEELAWLDLEGCELAVLSACDTSAGIRRAGQGVASLQNAAQSAGARSTITAMWAVPDEAARELMLAFYRGLWEKQLSKAEALWRAKGELRARRVPTRDWAAWVLTGAAD